MKFSDIPYKRPDLDAIIAGEKAPEGLGIDDAIALTELLEGSYIADESNKYVVK